MVSRFALSATLLAATLTSVCSAQMLSRPSLSSDPGRTGLATASMMTGTISGQVRGPDNQAIGDARVEVHDMRNGSILASGYTRPNGSFDLENIPVGSYEVVAIKGINEARGRVDTSSGDGNLELRLNVPQGAQGSGATISIAQMKVPSKAQDALHEAEKKYAKHKLDDAYKQVAKALEVYPQYAAALTFRGIMNLQEGKAAEASHDLESALKADANYGLTYIALGAMYNASSHFDDALRSLDRAITLLPNSWQAQFELARACLGKGQFELALQHINRAEGLAGHVFAPVYLVKAHALMGLKNYPDALTQLQQYLAADPNGPNAIQARQALETVKSFTTSAQAQR